MSQWTRVGRLIRTLRHLRPRQLVAQIEHGVRGIRPPEPLAEAPPVFAAARAAVAFLPAPPHARFDGWQRLQLINRERAIGDPPDWEFAGEGPLYAYHLHQFDYLRRPGIRPEARTMLILDWIQRHRNGIGWDPHPICLRILSWGKLLLTPGALTLSDEEAELVRTSLVEQLHCLSRNVEVRLQANHLLSNLLGLVFGGLMLKGERADQWLARWPALREQIEIQVPADGLHYERSPMYHSLLLENLLDLLNLARTSGVRAPRDLAPVLESATARMLKALAVLTHPDGRIALFADSAHGIAHPPRQLALYASALGVGSEEIGDAEWLEESGYLRIQSGDLVLIASVAGPSPPHQPGHAHCDALAFELSCGEERVVSDTGVYEYIPGPLRDRARATRSHATIELDGADQAELWSAHRIGGRPEVQGGPLRAVEGGLHFEGRCASWSTPRTVHHRRFVAHAGEAGRIEIEDRLEGPRVRSRITLPMAVGVGVDLEADASGAPVARLSLPSGRLLGLRLPPLEWRVEEMGHFPEFGRREGRLALVAEPAEFREGTFRFEAEPLLP